MTSASNSPTDRVKLRVATIAGAFSATLGLVVLVGWYTHTAALIQVFPTFVPMQYNTALGFLLCGAALVALVHGPTRLVAVLGSLGGVIGLLTVIEYIFGIQLGIDELFIEHYVTLQSSNPGRMAPNTALCFTMVGAALIDASRGRDPKGRFWTLAALAVGVFSLSSVALAGYLVGAQSAYGWGQLTRMAVHTSVGFIALSIGLLAVSLHRSRTWLAGIDTSSVHDPKRERRRIVGASVAIMAVVSTSVGLTMIWELYSTALNGQRDHLVELVSSRAEMIKAVASFDAENSDDVRGGTSAATLSQITEAIESSAGFGRTGEFTVATRRGDEINFLGLPPPGPGDFIESLSFGSASAEPMQRALAGESGSLIGIDYAGNTVIGAYTFVPSLNLGIVAKMDVAEVRAPFVRSALLTAVIAILIIGLGTSVTLVSVGPLVRRVEIQATSLRAVNLELQREATAREESMRSLGEREELLQGIYETYPDLQFVLERDGTIVRYSAPAEAELYATPQEFLGKRMQDILPATVGPLWVDALQEAAEGRGLQTFEYSLPGAEEDRTYEARVSSTPDGQIVAIARDITERKILEEFLVFVAQRNWGEEGDVFLRSLASFLGETLNVSHAFIDRLLPGGTKVRTVGLYSLGELVPDIDYELEHTPCQNVLAGDFYSFPSDVQRRFPKDPLLADLGVESYAGMPLWDSSGNPIGLVGVMGTKPLENPALVEKALRIVAVRAAHELEQQRARSQLERSESIVAHSSDLLALLDGNYTYLAANPAYLRAFGMTANDLIGHTVAEVVGEAFFDEVIRPHADRCLEGVDVEYKAWMDLPDSGKSYMHVKCSPQLGADGDVIGFIVNARDITELEEAQRSLTEMNVGLERLVEERTAQLVEANSELEAFTSSVSHDLKVPLRAIDGYAGMLVEQYASSLPEDAQRLLDVVRGSTKKMATLIDDLLDFSRLSHADKVITEVNMHELAQAVFSEIATVEEDREVEFSLGELPTVQGDLGLLRQVWTNLLENALKFTGRTKVARIDVSCQNELDHWVFCVRDNGAGFDMAYADNLFGVFQRLHDEDDFPGTGVGLATVHRIIQRHGGEVWAEGVVDEGARISFRLPHTVEPT